MNPSDDTRLEIDITNLREQRRPLWMSSLGIDHPADMIGGGGDIWTDRLTTEWPKCDNRCRLVYHWPGSGWKRTPISRHGYVPRL